VKLVFPSREFDEAIAAVCHGSASDEQARQLNQVLRTDPAARDAYILRLELHARLASDPDLFLRSEHEVVVAPGLKDALPFPRGVCSSGMESSRGGGPGTLGRLLAWAACLVLLAVVGWALRVSRQEDRQGAASQVVGMPGGVLRHEAWWAAGGRLNEDPALLVHLDFETTDPSGERLSNASRRTDAPSDATIVGCQWSEGRWPNKRALQFRGVSDRVRLEVSGEYEALTLVAWVRVQGLDRQIQSIFMSDGFESGTVHWSIRQDGVLGLTVIGSEPGRYQICASPPVLSTDPFGPWLHLAVVIDGGGQRVAHYLDGVSVGEQSLKISPPFRVGVAELGNWNAQGFPENDPFMIRNFSGAMDEFCLFSRALDADEIHGLFSAGKPQPDSLQQRRR
jgi:hypothetical protein